MIVGTAFAKATICGMHSLVEHQNLLKKGALNLYNSMAVVV
jgi:hypothetical protein